MRATSFVGEYGAIAHLYDTTPARLAGRDAASSEVPDRWVAWDRGTAVGAALARTRPDNRVFLSFAGEPAAGGLLSQAAHAALGRDLYTTLDEGSLELAASLRSVGFDTNLTTEIFLVSFSQALQSLRHTPVPSGIATVAAADADPDRLFALDNAVRSRVPGTDGWTGNRVWFNTELTDPAAYRVALDLHTGDYAGLARIWRNPDGPRFGLVGVTEEYRRTRLGPALIRLVLEQANEWGHRCFAAETALTNRYLHHRLQRIASRSLGRREQLVRRHPLSA